MNFQERYQRYKESVNINHISYFTPVAQELFELFEQEDAILTRLLSIWVENDYEPDIIQSTINEWKKSHGNRFPDFPFHLWKQIICPAHCNSRVSVESVDSLRLTIMNNREAGINTICCCLIFDYVNGRPGDILEWLNSWKTDALAQIVESQNQDEYKWDVIDYYHLCCLVNQDSVDFQIICQEIEGQKEQQRLTCKRRVCSKALHDKQCEKRDKRVIMHTSDSNNVQENSCNVPIRLTTEIPDPDVVKYLNYNIAKDLIIQYRLPYWLDNQIKSLEENFDNSSNTNVQSSCTGDKEFWEIYYQVRHFPRTLCETFFVFNEEFATSCPIDQDGISILSIGCGSGGDIIGLLIALDVHLSNVTYVSIVVYEVNDNAFECLQNNLKLVKSSFSHIKIKILARNKYAIKIGERVFYELENSKYDYILCSKMVNEILRAEFKEVVNNWDGQDTTTLEASVKELNDKRFSLVYNTLLGTLKQYIKTNGYCFISEPTDKPIPKELTKNDNFSYYCRSHNEYEGLRRRDNVDEIIKTLNESIPFLPQLLNAGVKSFIRHNDDFRPVSPRFCDGCWTRTDCFTQMQFYIHNPLLNKSMDRFEGLCFRLIKKANRTKRAQGLPNAVINTKINTQRKEFVLECCKMGRTGKHS